MLSILANALETEQYGEVTNTARARVRAELTAEIKDAARRQLAEVGAPALSLRAVAREVGMVSSAVYRYFPSRDELLTALIVDAYDAVGQVAEEAVEHAPPTVIDRWLAIARAVRRWALAHPNEYALIYGSPVPGYGAPVDTIDPAARPALAMLRIAVDGVADGEIDDCAHGPTMARSVRADLAGLRRQAAPGVSDEVLARGLAAWTQLFGTISFELFGHLHNVIHDYDAFFDHEMRRAGEQFIGA
jgi:AcrR family transcriptional regulator